MAGAIFERVLTASQQDTVADGLGTDIDHARNLVKCWAGLHDLGKAIPGFQQLDKGAFTNLASCTGWERAGQQGIGVALRHERGSHLVLPKLFESEKYPTANTVVKRVGHQVAQLLGGHHGYFGEALSPQEMRNPELLCSDLGQGVWETERERLFDVVTAVTGHPEPPQALMRAEAVVLVLGSVILADWLVSQETFLRQRISDLPASGTLAAIEAHARATRGLAPTLIADAGLEAARFARRGFHGMFPKISDPNELQTSLASKLPALANGPGLLLICAPTGEGKTEAALFGARVLGDVSSKPGMYMALPTMATADQMHRRMAAFAADNLLDDAALTLLHSSAWLSDEEDSAANDTALPDDVVISDAGRDDADRPDGVSVVANRWLRGAHRGLIAPLAVGTVDQPLLGVLPTKFNMLRLFGLSGKVVVIDEAHAYERYTHEVLCLLLTWLGALRVPVVALSATLTGRVAASLVNAYRAGCGYREPAAESTAPHYPGWLFADAATGRVVANEHVGSARSRSVETRFLKVRHTYDAAHDAGRMTEILRQLDPLLHDRGCAAVICTTVAEAQETYRALRDRFDELGDKPELLLLHARFPLWRRDVLTRRVEQLFGKDEKGRKSRRPRAAVLVATQIVEQSLDLDLDLIISDLAPLSLLLQRTGRCWRHERPAGVRPLWLSGPRLCVLAPVDDAGVQAFPEVWGKGDKAVYDESLLRRTFDILDRRGDQAIRVPEDVQDLVEEVYADDFVGSDRVQQERADMNRLANELAQVGMAGITAVPRPAQVRNLHQLTDKGLDPDLVVTRLGIDTVRVVPCFVDADGERWLDPECTAYPLPQPNRRGRFTLKQARAVVRHAVSVRNGTWMGERGPEHAPPDAWEKDHRLAGLVLLPMERVDGGVSVCRVGKTVFTLSDEFGLEIQRQG